MDIIASRLDWSHLRTFVAVAETGSLTAAAKQLGQSQPTTGRHIKAAEMALGTELFTRNLRGLSLTEAGLSMLAPARDMAAAAARLETVAAGRDERISGTVRITASVVVSHYILPPIIGAMRSQEPGIEIEIVPSDASENLIFREADIALRMYRPTQLDVIAKHITTQPIALYAARTLIKKFGQPQTVKDLAALPFVGFDKSDLIIRTMRDLGLNADRHFFGVRCDDQSVFWKLVCAGCGVGAMQAAIGDAEPRVVRTDYQPDLPSLPIWLAAPEALHTNARIKRVWDLLVADLEKLGS